MMLCAPENILGRKKAVERQNIDSYLISTYLSEVDDDKPANLHQPKLEGSPSAYL